MKELNRAKGSAGEILATQYLTKKKYEIVQTNYSNKIGEIDIIAKDGKTLVFIEVKSRKTLKFGRPCEAVGVYKQNKIRQVATLYLMMKKIKDTPIRFDVIEVLDGEINHIINAF